MSYQAPEVVQEEIKVRIDKARALLIDVVELHARICGDPNCLEKAKVTIHLTHQS
jgi:hypothetical protein